MRKWLHKTIREELWLCYDFSVNCIAIKEYGFFLIETGVHPDKIEMTLEKINEILDKIIINWIDDKYLQFNKIITLDEWINSFEQVKKKDIENMLPLLEKDKRYTFYIK